MPSAIKDRLTNRYEFVFHLTRSRRYYFNLDPLRVPNVDPRTQKLTGPVRHGAQGLAHSSGAVVAGNFVPDPRGKNPGDVWAIGPDTRPKRFIVPGKTMHYAPFPESLGWPGRVWLVPVARSLRVPIAEREISENAQEGGPEPR